MTAGVRACAMQKLWINGREVAHTPREELRLAIRTGRSMADAEQSHRRGLMSAAAFARFERLWAVSTATEHRYTARWTLERWRSRRDAACAAIRRVRDAA